MDSVKTELELLIKDLRFSQELEKDFFNLIRKIVIYYHNECISFQYADSCIIAAYEEYRSILLFRLRRGDYDKPDKEFSTCGFYSSCESAVGICHLEEIPVFPNQCCNNYEEKND